MSGEPRKDVAPPAGTVTRRDLREAYADRDLLTDLRAATLLDAEPLAGLTLFMLIAALLAGFIWASTAALDEVTLAEGKVIPSSREQLIQSLEGGILAEMLVREGDVVEADEVLLKIDDTRFDASLREGQSRQDALRAAIARLEAEASGRAPVFPPDIAPSVIELERRLYDSRRRTLDQALATLRESLRLAEQELAMTAPLIDKGAVSEVEVLRLRREVSELRGSIQERRNAFQGEARSERADKAAELAAMAAINTAREDQVARAVVRAPMRGTVKNVRITTVGGVIQPGMDIMEIVPLEDRLLIEARVRPADVAFLRPGLRAKVKVTAYDFSIYGGLDGTLEHISADTIVDEKNPNETFYRILVRTDTPNLQGPNGALPIIAGMTATVEVLTGRKTVLDYLLKPVLKVRDSALRER